MAVQTYTGLTAEQQTFYQRILLERLLPNLTLCKYGMKKSIPKNSGKSTEFRRFNSLETPTASLTEGVTPSGNSLDITAIVATLTQEGDYVEVSDILDLTGKDKVIAETTVLLAEQAAKRLEELAYAELKAGTNVQIAGNKTRETITATDKATVADIKKIVRTLKNADVKPVSGNCYVGVFSPMVTYDLQNDPEWIDISKYAANTQLLTGEIGKIHGVRILESTLISAVKGGSGSNVDVYQNIIFGKDTYGVVDLDGAKKPEIIVHSREVAGGPLEQRSTIGWKMLFAAKRLQDLGIVRYECAATA